MATVLTVAGTTPEVTGAAYLAPTAVVAGDVTLAAGVSIWFGSVLRAEMAPITIGRDSNVQDNCVIHTDLGFPATLGDEVTVGHRVVLHGCTIEDGALVGMGAVVMNGATIGAGSIVGAGAVVTEGTQVPAGSIVVGAPGRVIDKPAPEGPFPNVAGYLALADAYRETSSPAGPA